MTSRAEDRDETRQYLLGGLSEEARRRVEERVLAEDGFLEELEVCEEELTDDYVGGRLPDAERVRFERHFLSTPERRRGLRFAQALDLYASRSAESAGEEPAASESSASKRPGWWARLLSFRGAQGWALAGAAAVALVAVIAFSVWLSRTAAPRTFATLTLKASAGDRSQGVPDAEVTLPPGVDALRVSLTLPERTPPAERYRVELLKDNGETQSLEAGGHDAQSVSVVIPARQLARGRYVLRLTAVKDDGAEQRVGSYHFAVG
jgi:hypothetical protein